MNVPEWDASERLWREANGQTQESIEPIRGDMQTSELLNERGATHGDFSFNAIYGQQLRTMFRQSSGWAAMPAVHKEALDMLACKLARILSGQSTFRGHWEDVRGYAALAEDACEK